VGPGRALHRRHAAGGGGHGAGRLHAADPATFCVCAVAGHGTPGGYRATIMVRNVHPHATPDH